MRAFLLISLIFTSVPSYAEDIVKFRPRPVVVSVDNNNYIGILLSEEEFTKILNDKVINREKNGICKVDHKICEGTKDIYLTELHKLRSEIQKSNTWFRRNKGSLGLFTGLVVGVATSIGIAKAIRGE
jgi:hypothetical protein